MPFRLASHANPVLSLEEAWDVAAFVNSQPRPQFDQAGDWPDVNKKPVDFPFGPFADTFPEKQHKYGPFEPIENARKKKTSNCCHKKYTPIKQYVPVKKKFSTIHHIGRFGFIASSAFC